MAVQSLRRFALAVAALMTLALSQPAGAGASEPPRIGKPRPAPPGPANVPTLTPAEIDPILVIGGEDIAARKSDTRLNVDVHVNGRGPYRFVVDSGADTSVIGRRAAEALQLPLGTPAVLNAMTARNVVDRVQVQELSVGSSKIHDLELPALREENIGSDGLIGIDALADQRLMLDFDRRLIRVEDAHKPPPYNPDEIVIVAKRRRGQLILTRVDAGGVSLDAVIDTGSELTIGNSALRDRLIHRDAGQLGTVEVTGVTGVTVKLEMMVVDELDLGPITLQNVPIAFADVPPFELFGLSHQPALLVGTDLLETFRRVSLDFRARRVRFQIKHCSPHGVVIVTAASQILSRLYSGGGAETCAH